MTSYPRRDSHFAHRFVRVLHKSCAAQELGPATCWLLTVIAHTEDAARYTGPVTFWNSQLMETMGFRSPKQLDDVRNRAMKAKWLEYSRKGTRAPGEYFVTIPSRFTQITDTPIESGAELGSILSADGKNRDGFFPNSTIISEGTRNESVKESGKPSTLSLSLSLNTSPGQAPDVSPLKAAKKPTPTPGDQDTAKWMWERILELQPERKPPSLEKWAGTIRLMRERDGRTHEAIRELFSRVQSDSFWAVNVLCPETLREKWDDLSLKLNGNRRISRNGKPEAQYPKFTRRTPAQEAPQ